MKNLSCLVLRLLWFTLLGGEVCMAADPVLNAELVNRIFTGDERVSRQTLARLEKGESKDPALYGALANALNGYYAASVDGSLTDHQRDAHEEGADLREWALRILRKKGTGGNVDVSQLIQKAALQDLNADVRVTALNELAQVNQGSPELVQRLARRMADELDSGPAETLGKTIVKLSSGLEPRQLSPVVESLAMAANGTSVPQIPLATLAELAKRDRGARLELEAMAKNAGARYRRNTSEGAAKLLIGMNQATAGCPFHLLSPDGEKKPK